MSWRPFNTLTGRLVLVTIVAVFLSYAVAYVLFSNERGAALRRAAETSVIERVGFTTERLRDTPADQRPTLVHGIRDYGIRYAIDAAPTVDESTSGDGARLAASLSERLNGLSVRGATRTIVDRRRHWGARPMDDGPPPQGEAHPHHDDDEDDLSAERHRPDPAPPVELTEVRFSVDLGDGAWLNARARLPGPRPAPISVLFAGLVAIIAVGVGAALVSRQIGQPLAELTNAARTLGSGQTNVTAPVSGPEDVRRASTAFNAMAERLGRQLNRQRQMLWALSHDLRTPITALRLRAELIEDDAARQRLLAPIAEMEALTEQALSLARAGASDEARVRIDLADLVRTLCGELQDAGVQVTADADAPVMAECRPSEIARALRNLAENAAKYAGGGTMRAYPSGGEAIVEVLDDGPGVPADQLAQIATPFFRADSARTTADGAGLGLAIAQAIADEHGGRLEFANRTPRGFMARFALPA